MKEMKEQKKGNKEKKKYDNVNFKITKAKIDCLCLFFI
jgi:hypothetical protein